MVDKTTDELVAEVRSEIKRQELDYDFVINLGLIEEIVDELARRAEQADKLREAMRQIGRLDYRGHPSSEQEIARRALDAEEPKMVRDPGYELPDAGMNSRKW